MEVDVPNVGYTDCHIPLKVAQQFVAIGTAIWAVGAAAAQYDGRLPTISVGRGHLAHLWLLRVPIVAIEATQGQSIDPTNSSQNGDWNQVMDDSEAAQQRAEYQAHATEWDHG